MSVFRILIADLTCIIYILISLRVYNLYPYLIVGFMLRLYVYILGCLSPYVSVRLCACICVYHSFCLKYFLTLRQPVLSASMQNEMFISYFHCFYFVESMEVYWSYRPFLLAFCIIIIVFCLSVSFRFPRVLPIVFKEPLTFIFLYSTTRMSLTQLAASVEARVTCALIVLIRAIGCGSHPNDGSLMRFRSQTSTLSDLAPVPKGATAVKGSRPNNSLRNERKWDLIWWLNTNTLTYGICICFVPSVFLRSILLSCFVLWILVLFNLSLRDTVSVPLPLSLFPSLSPSLSSLSRYLSLFVPISFCLSRSLWLSVSLYISVCLSVSLLV